MDAFDDKHIVRVHAHVGAKRFPGACGEVVFGDFHLFAGDEVLQVLVEQFQINGFESVEVVMAVGVERGLVPINEVVVQGKGYGFQAVDSKLSGQTAGECGFAGGRRTGDQDDLDGAAIVGNGVGDG